MQQLGFLRRALASFRLSLLTRLILVLYSFLCGVVRAVRRHAPLFIINEAEDRGKGQWGERKRAAGRHAVYYQ
jgi:hypothetical protein